MSAAPGTPEPLEAAVALDQDAYCPGCGYNVRGLAGDPIRCPECGNRYARSELHWPKQRRVMPRLERCQRNLKASADLCALATLPVLLAAWCLVDNDNQLRSSLPGGMASASIWPFALTSASIWLLGCSSFAIRCWGLRGWIRALAIYHLTAVPAMLANLTLVIVTWILLWRLCGRALDALMRAVSSTVIANTVEPVLCLATMLPFAWLVVRLDPMSIVKRIGADRLAALAQQLAERMPAEPTRGGSDTSAP